MTDMDDNPLFPELGGWEEIEKRASSDPIRGKSTLAEVASTKKLVHSLANLRSSVSSQVSHLNNTIKELNNKISEFSNETTKLSSKANKLIWWYVILTGVIAAATVINIFT